MKTKKKSGLKILLCVLGTIVVLFAALYLSLLSAGKKLDAVQAVDMNTVKDGTYYGSAQAVMVKVKVEVSVKDHKITDIKLLKHQNGRGTPAESMLGAMLGGNTAEVDAVSGATLSSKAMRAAVNTALLGGVEK